MTYEQAKQAERAAWEAYELAMLSQTRYLGTFESSRAGKAYQRWLEAKNRLQTAEEGKVT